MQCVITVLFFCPHISKRTPGNVYYTIFNSEHLSRANCGSLNLKTQLFRSFPLNKEIFLNYLQKISVEMKHRNRMQSGLLIKLQFLFHDKQLVIIQRYYFIRETYFAEFIAVNLAHRNPFLSYQYPVA